MRQRQGRLSHFPRAWAGVHRLGANGGTTGTLVGGLPSPPPGDARTTSKALASRLLGRLRALFSHSIGQAGCQACAAQPSRETRLQAIAFKLETILDELDEIGAQRIAIDVCMALERVRARLLADDASAPPEPVGDH